MNESLTPKQVASAIGVSESSLKRWCDRGLLRITRTAGGHRRLPLSEVVQFLRKSGHRIVRPELLGLPSNTGSGSLVRDRAMQSLTAALEKSDEAQCRRIILDLYLANHTICDICDNVIAAAFHHIGDDWDCGSIDVYQERRACEIALHVLIELQSMLRAPDESAPHAIGGTLAGDPYHLATTMAEAVLREVGWNAESYGSGLPLESAQAAVNSVRPALFWLSVSHIDCVESFLEQYAKLYETAAACGVALVVGGRALSEPVRRCMQYAAFCDNFGHLVAFAESMHRSRLLPEGE